MNLIDMPDDLDFGNTPAKTQEQHVAEVAERLAAANTAADALVYKDTCPRCSGTGKFRSMYGSLLGQCFACKGMGHKAFKTSAADRTKAREKTHARAATAAQGNLDVFAAEHPEAWAWMTSNGDFEFARNMVEAIRKFGSLTERQLAAVEKCVEGAKARAAAREAEKAAQAARATTVDAGALFAAFLKAAAAGLKFPKLSFGTFTVKRASATGKNPGALYVAAGEQYLGKIQDGQFFPSRECTDEVKVQVVALIEDPAAAVKAYGLRTGNCAICNRTLTAGESIERGIGPICAEKFGF